MQGGSPEPRSRRHGVGAEATSTKNLSSGGLRQSLPAGTQKSAATIARIMGAVKTNIIFSRLNEQQLAMLHRAMVEHHVPAGSNVITQGEKGNPKPNPSLNPNPNPNSNSYPNPTPNLNPNPYPNPNPNPNQGVGRDGGCLHRPRTALHHCRR